MASMCYQEQCFRKFNDRYVFGRHLELNHLRSNSKQQSVKAVHAQTLPTSSLATQSEVNNDTSVSSGAVLFSAQDDSQSPSAELHDHALRYIAECKSRTTTLHSAQQMIHGCSNLIEHVVCNIEEDLGSLKYLCKNSDDVHNFESVFKKVQRYRNPLQGLESKYMQRKALEKAGCYIAPVKYSVGSSLLTTVQNQANFLHTSLSDCTGQFVSVKSTITALHAKTDVIRHILTAQEAERCNQTENPLHIKSFANAAFWNKHPLRGERIILIRLYGGDVEVANPLGSHRTLYKIGTVYYQFEHLPVHMQSKLENISLCLCYYTDDVKSFGWANILRPVIDELQTLESEGLELYVDGELLNVKVVVIGVTGDNLFLNSILGFAESSMANFPCRHCLVP